MAYLVTVEKLEGKLPNVAWKRDAETEILSGQFRPSKKAEKGLTGSVELTGAEGSYVMLDVAGGAVRGLEVVVWPDTTIVDGLTAPAAASQGRLLMPARASQPGIAAVEVDAHLSVEKRANESVIHLRVGPRRKVNTVEIANGLIVEIDGDGNIAGLWLQNVPPFPKPDA